VKPMPLIQQRVLAVLLLLLLIIAIVLGIAIPLRKQHQRYDDRIDEIVDRTSRFQRIAKLRTQQSETLAAMRTKDVNRFTLKNSAANLAGAELQDAVRASVETNGGRINTIQIITPREENGHRVYVVSTSFNGTVNQLQKVLHATESREPYIFIDSLTVRSLTTRGLKPAPGQEPQVMVTMEASAFAPMPPIKTGAAEKKEKSSKSGDKA
jgi:general secretion pathway protein M